MDLPLVKSTSCSCKKPDRIDDNLPSLDDYNQSRLIITYLPSPRSYNNDLNYNTKFSN